VHQHPHDRLRIFVDRVSPPPLHGVDNPTGVGSGAAWGGLCNKAASIILRRHAGPLRQKMAYLGHAPHVIAGVVRAGFDDVAQAQDQLGLGVGDLLTPQDVGQASLGLLDHGFTLHTYRCRNRTSVFAPYVAFPFAVIVQSQSFTVCKALRYHSIYTPFFRTGWPEEKS
jgi:hypothetical protein